MAERNTIRSKWYARGHDITFELNYERPLTPDVLDRVRRVVLAIEAVIRELNEDTNAMERLEHKNEVARLETERREATAIEAAKRNPEEPF